MGYQKQIWHYTAVHAIRKDLTSSNLCGLPCSMMALDFLVSTPTPNGVNAQSNQSISFMQNVDFDSLRVIPFFCTALKAGYKVNSVFFIGSIDPIPICYRVCR